MSGYLSREFEPIWQNSGYEPTLGKGSQVQIHIIPMGKKCEAGVPKGLSLLLPHKVPTGHPLEDTMPTFPNFARDSPCPSSITYEGPYFVHVKIDEVFL